MSSAKTEYGPLDHSRAGSYPPTASRSAQAFDRRQNLARRLLPLLPTDDQTPISTTDLGRRLGLTGRDRDQLLWPILDRLTHAGLTRRTRRGRSCSWSQTPLLTGILTAAHRPGETTPRPCGLTENLPTETVDAAVATLAWCGLAAAPTTGQTSASRVQPYLDTTPASPPPAQLSALAGPPTVRAVAVIGSHPGSRTRALAGAALDALTASGVLQLAGPPVIIELGATCPVAACTCCRHRPRHPDPFAAVQSAQLLIAATPSQLGTVSGLLKLFLDQIRPGGLTGIVAVAAALETSRGHHTTTATTLNQLLGHLGAVTPAPPLVVHGPVDPQPDAARWAAQHARRIQAGLPTTPPHHHEPPSAHAR
ncbi:NAD(P)H-dependent oxidoreductase [Actinoplanes sp. Pm04-4]|uniref:NAD(P)H-dependent oxidoreductase n=1 Tax=Paractinoplanes pyxinae TaxID=2997416 RepID=A0ABT4B7B0_9ACTN|nr:NAD(P)H-dependent oxidoreductase [Actinoplanes pyxinae]MCY1141493.1 NAD(P)H-dependent oxidoreductase [Actinoplanes pyxinae]